MKNQCSRVVYHWHCVDVALLFWSSLFGFCRWSSAVLTQASKMLKKPMFYWHRREAVFWPRWPPSKKTTKTMLFWSSPIYSDVSDVFRGCCGGHVGGDRLPTLPLYLSVRAVPRFRHESREPPPRLVGLRLTSAGRDARNAYKTNCFLTFLKAVRFRNRCVSIFVDGPLWESRFLQKCL